MVGKARRKEALGNGSPITSTPVYIDRGSTPATTGIQVTQHPSKELDQPVHLTQHGLFIIITITQSTEFAAAVYH